MMPHNDTSTCAVGSAVLVFLHRYPDTAPRPYTHLLLLWHASIHHSSADPSDTEQCCALSMHLLRQLTRRQQHQHTRLHSCCCSITVLLLLLRGCGAAAAAAGEDACIARQQVRQRLATACRTHKHASHTTTRQGLGAWATANSPSSHPHPLSHTHNHPNCQQPPQALTLPPTPTAAYTHPVPCTVAYIRNPTAASFHTQPHPPGSACPSRSRPAAAGPQQDDWMGVGSVNPSLAMQRATTGCSPDSFRALSAGEAATRSSSCCC